MLRRFTLVASCQSISLKNFTENILPGKIKRPFFLIGATVWKDIVFNSLQPIFFGVFNNNILLNVVTRKIYW